MRYIKYDETIDIFQHQPVETVVDIRQSRDICKALIEAEKYDIAIQLTLGEDGATHQMH